MIAIGDVVRLLMDDHHEEARRACRKLLQAQPALPEAHLLMAEISRKLGDAERAREALERTLRLRPGWTEAHTHSAIADLLGDFQRFDEAAERYRRALELAPELHDARYNRAGALQAAGRPEEAITELQALLARQPRAADAREHLMRLLLAARRYDELDAAAQEGMHLFPEAPLYPERLGMAHWRRQRYAEGLAAFRLARARAAPGSEAHRSAKFNIANALLTLGQLAEGWTEYHWRTSRPKVRSRYPELTDRPASVASTTTPMRIRIVGEQGFGDDLFFLRFAPALRDRGHELAMNCDARLAPLLSRMPQLLQHINPREFKADITLCSGDLPLASGQAAAPPLALPLDAERRERWATRLRAFGPAPYVAVNWRAGVLPEDVKPQAKTYWIKDVPPQRLAEVLSGLDARIVILQRRPSREDLSSFRQALGREALDLGDANDDLQDALALLSLIDEYVGVSNTNVHLRAGISGAGSRVLVRTPSEWRWSGDERSSRWFPGVRVYRDVPGEDWTSALSDLKADLAQAFAASQQK